MPKLAFIFPGQGSQFISMGEELYNASPTARDIWEHANDILGFSLTDLCFAGDAQQLNLTTNAQPAILTASIAAFMSMKEQGITPDMCAGHSLGEYSALVAAQSLSFAHALELVRHRGELMEKAYPRGQGGMASILGLDELVIEQTCEKHPGQVQVANYNCPGQVVISGEKTAVEEVGKLLKQQGAKMVISLDVSGPFHSSLMKKAGEGMAGELAKVTIKEPQIPVYSNVTGQAVSNSDEIRTNLVNQLSSPVLWEKTIGTMIDFGASTFVEVGPGKVLAGLLKRINRKIPCHNVGCPLGLEKLVAQEKGDIVR